MSKYLEALNFFKRVAHHVPLKSATDEFCEEYDGNLIVLKELVEKATPKKPIKGYIFTDVEKAKEKNIPNFETFRCASCGSIINNKNYKGKQTYNYCPSCGQRIDWSEDED